MKTKSAMITIAGRPNVGKSTLTNYLVGEKIAIVSNKPQTTRNRICGIVTRGDTQFVFVDTPGYHRARTKLGDYMVNVARESISDVDLTILVVEPIASIGPQEEGLIDKIKSSHCPAILAINKIDTVEKDTLLEVIAVYSQAAAFDAIIPISAKTGDGVEDLLETCGKYAEESPFLFPEDVTTDQPERQVMAEIIREKLLCYFRQQSEKEGANTFTLPFSLSTLADYIATDRSAMMRELKRLREEGTVSSDGRRFTLRS